MKLGIDIGGTSVPFGLVDSKDLIVLEEVLYIKDFKNIEALLMAIKKRSKEYDAQVKIEGVGIGAPNGHFKNGTIENAPNLPWKGTIPLRTIAEKIFNAPVVVDNDANVAAIGEAHHGVGKSFKNFVHLTLGTGLGAGIIIDGKIFRGASMMAGELGHTIVEREGRLCECGKKGCLETYASVTGIWHTALEYSKQVKDFYCDEMKTPQTCSKMIFEEAEKSNPIAEKIFDYTGDQLALGIANIHYVLGTETFIIGGGLSKAGAHLLTPTLKNLKKYTTPLFYDQFTVQLSKAINGELVILGAVSLLDEIDN